MQFESVADQRAHYKSDWHRFNLARKGKGQVPVAEDDFDRLIEAEEVGSIEGSDSEEDDPDLYQDEAGGGGAIEEEEAEYRR